MRPLLLRLLLFVALRGKCFELRKLQKIISANCSFSSLEILFAVFGDAEETSFRRLDIFRLLRWTHTH